MIVDLFAGPGGWSEGLRALGCSEIGIELDEAACKTARAAGHKRVREDVSALSPSDFAGAEGLIASAPCPTFSGAGRGAGRLLTAVIVRCMDDLLAGSDRRWDARGEAYVILEPVAIADERAKAKAKGREPDIDKAKARARRDADMSLLVVEPLRYALAIRPRWVALEQVPDVLGLWKHMARLLRTVGYHVWAGVLEAERYGVPQTRERAILMAHRDRPVHPPVATHQRYVPGEPQRHDVTLEGEVRPWVSMAAALGWGMTERPTHTVTGGGTGAGGGVEVFGSGDVRRIVDREREAGRWVAMRANAQANAAVRPTDEPSPTITGGHDTGDRVWVHDRPATNVNCDPRISPPGRHDPDVSGSQQEGAIRVTEQEAAILQSFRPDYPWAGSRTKRFEQIGNAVPPLLAEAVLRCLVDVPAELAEAA